MEKIVLEQVFQSISPRVRAWLMCNGPTSLVQATAHLENYSLAERASRLEPSGPVRGPSKSKIQGPAEEGPKAGRSGQPNTQYPECRSSVFRIPGIWGPHGGHGDIPTQTPQPGRQSNPGRGAPRRAQDCPLMECEIGWEVYPTDRAKTSQNPPLTIQVRIGQHIVTALLDTGSSVSMV